MQIVIRLLHNRQEHGKNAMIPIVGPTGVGKSYCALSLMVGLYLYRHGVEPTAEYMLKHTFFKARDFLMHMKQYSDALNNNTKLQLEETLWDETGVDASSRSWQSAQNKVISFYAQTCRNQRQIIFFTVPSLSFIDVNLRKLMHYYIEVISYDKKTNISIAKPLEIQYNLRQDKIYYHNLCFPQADGLLEVDFLATPKVREDIAVAYEKIKSKFTSNLNDDIISVLNKLEAKNNPQESLTDRQKIIIEHWERGEFRTGVIAKALGVQDSIVSVNIKFLKNKGFFKENYKEKSGLRDIDIENLPAKLNLYTPTIKNDNQQEVINNGSY